jgi:hypothetical protein
MRFGIRSLVAIVITSMQAANAQDQSVLRILQAAYDETWCRYLAATTRWQSLQPVPKSDNVQLQEAESAVGVAEAEYRQARNRFAQYLLDHRSHPNGAVESELHPAVSRYHGTSSACFECA